MNRLREVNTRLVGDRHAARRPLARPVAGITGARHSNVPPGGMVLRPRLSRRCSIAGRAQELNIQR